MIDHKYTEAAFPWLGAAAVSTLIYLVVPDGIIQKAAQKLTGPMIDISAIAFGFMMTISAMLISIESKPAVQTLRGVGAYPTLLRYLKAPVYSWILVCVFSALMMLVDENNSRLHIFISVWSGLVAFAFLSTLRISRVMFNLLTLPNSRQKKSDSPRSLAAAGGQ